MIKNIVSLFIEFRVLIIESTKRDLQVLNKGAFLGHAWLFLGPLIQTGAYVIIVSFLLGGHQDAKGNLLRYALYVLGGMIPWQIISRCLTDAPSLIRSRMDLVKQVIYPVETLPLTGLLVGSCGALVSFCVFLLLGAITGTLGWGILLVPVPFFFMVVFLVGASWILAVLGIFLKDLREVVSTLVAILVYFTPVVATPDLTGTTIWKAILLNPLSHIILCFRDTYRLEFSWVSWAVFLVMAGLVFAAGGWLITRTKLMINEYL
jgi:lipopolysaccharide transport system permease protein